VTGGRPGSAPERGGSQPAAAPPPPEVLFRRFGARAELLVRYAGWLAGPGTVRGLLGPREVPRLWERHVLNSVALAELLPDRARLVDIGSGAGLPGLAVACVRPDLTVDLVEPLLRRTGFLTEVVADLGIGQQVRVVRGRAEDSAVLDKVGSAQFVTARAVAPLDRLVRWSFPLLRPGGSLLALKGTGAEDELTEHQQVLARMRAEVRGVIECGAELVDPPTRIVHLVRAAR
jgi:16S rRNA (guanine527-N7)-methyltransferase